MELTILRTEALEALAAKSGQKPQDYITTLIDKLAELGLIDGEYEDMGMFVDSVINGHNIMPLIEFDKWITQEEDLMRFLELKVVGIHDCPECGAEVEHTTDGAWGQEWDQGECENPFCMYTYSNEPDWDLSMDR